MRACAGMPPKIARAMSPSLHAPAVCDDDGPTMTGPMMSKRETIILLSYGVPTACCAGCDDGGEHDSDRAHLLIPVGERDGWIWTSRRAEGVAASPPNAVSRYATGIRRPTSPMTSITSSAVTGKSQPASDISAAAIACIAADAFRYMHGISTSPPIGSQIRPSMPWSESATAVETCSFVPPAIQHTAAAPMAAAVPVSAWQPPSAPDS